MKLGLIIKQSGEDVREAVVGTEVVYGQSLGTVQLNGSINHPTQLSATDRAAAVALNFNED